ncbi:MAG TPA: AAA family ATPase [Kiritimatiellia bacterium]|nr:AAA family ATPase [Kiritimatiellia bacterium]
MSSTTNPMTIQEAAEVYLAFEDHLNSLLWGRNDDDTPGTIQLILNAFFANEHILFEDFPGSGKSYMASGLAKLIEDDIVEAGVDIVHYKRIQCVPDLLPSDVTGFTMIQGGEKAFQAGSIFAYFVLVDEINRTTPKVQSAFLEAMAERKVTVDGREHSLGELFFVIATQNPLDRVGTFELPAAQLDRFLFKRRLSPIKAHYECRVLLDEVLKNAAEHVRATQDKLRQAVDRHYPGNEPWADKPRDSGEKIGVTRIVAAKQCILANVGVHEDLVPRILHVADAIQARYDRRDGGFRRGSRPSVRSMQKFIKAAKVRAFIEQVSRDRTAAEGILAVPRHFRELACDLLRHRLIPLDTRLGQEPDRLDALIREIVNEIIPE